MRKIATITIDAEGRDKGKVFVLTEMSATQAEKWAARAFLAMGRSGIDVPPNIAEAGMAGIAMLGIRALGGLKWEDAEPLLDEMFECVQVKPSEKVVRGLIEDDVEEVATRLKLRAELAALHTGFSSADALWASMRVRAPATSNSSNIQTSQEPSGQ